MAGSPCRRVRADSARSRRAAEAVAFPSCPATGAGGSSESGAKRRPGIERVYIVGSVIKKRRKRMAKKKHRKLLKRTRIQRRRAGK